MKKLFSTGLVILLPIILTLMIIGFLINFLTRPFLSPVEAFLTQTSLFNGSILFFNESTVIILASKILILLGLAALVFLIGILGKAFFVDALIRLGDRLLHNLPYISKIYKACQDIVHSLFSSQSKSFSQVVLIPFPCEHNFCIGLVTKEALTVQANGQNTEEIVSVFVPGTPNPSVGFMLMFRKDQLIFLNMKVEDAMKFVISCGVVMPPIDRAKNEKQPS
ncbi:DUF502 domain-containing protein [Candidatus Protochlamydia phocaeensis]|uniref:DUF502 domain-containing protein n=1 Tax=Candidatus Protochlamydia phocaeensis TaxID=1414722 RepID=UPI000838CA54|nr:DUF502 domain-containing protein [Candidatus Protochlamydia phocaeensis]